MTKWSIGRMNSGAIHTAPGRVTRKAATCSRHGICRNRCNPDLRATCPVAHTDRFRGLYLPTRYADIREIAYDTENFSSRRVMVALRYASLTATIVRSGVSTR